MDSPRTRFEENYRVACGAKVEQADVIGGTSIATLPGHTRSPIDSRTIVRIETRQRNADTCSQTDTATYHTYIQYIYIYSICLCLCPVSCRQSSCSTSTASRGRGLKLKWKLKLRLRLEQRRLKTESEILRKDSHRHLGRKCSARISHKASTEGTEKTVRGTEVNLIKIITPLWVIT